MLQPGEIVGPYTIEREIGQGGMATVYKAHHVKLDRYVAIKVMHRNLLQDDNFRQRFNREAKIVARLEHPNIVPIYDYDEYSGQPYLVMKYVDGPTLKRRALKTGLTLHETINIMSVLAGAVDFAHSHDILHRDMKPSNVLIDGDDRPHVTDFGLARIAQVGESTISHDLMLGTPYYISPEQAQGERDLDHRTDLYSFGVILYELITGFVPFTADTPYAIVHGHIYSQPQPPSSRNAQLPTPVDRVLLKALAKKPEDRYDSATQMMNEFIAALGDVVPDDPNESIIVTPQVTNKAQPVQPAPVDQTPDATTQPKQGDRPVIENPREQRRDNQPAAMQDVREHRGKKMKVEGSLDFGKWDWSKIDFKRIEEGIENFATMMEERFDDDKKDKKNRDDWRTWQMTDDDGEDEVDYDPRFHDAESIARRRVKARLKARQEVVVHTLIFICINAMLFGIWIFSSGLTSFPWPFIPLLAWGSGLIGHWYEYRSEHGIGSEQFEKLVDREIELMRSRSQPAVKSKKAKNSKAYAGDEADNYEEGKHGEDKYREADYSEAPAIRLTEDGELTDSFVDDMSGRRGRSRRGRRHSR